MPIQKQHQVYLARTITVPKAGKTATAFQKHNARFCDYLKYGKNRLQEYILLIQQNNRLHKAAVL